MKTNSFRKQKFYCLLGLILLLLGTSAIRGKQLAANVIEAELLTTEIRQLGEVRTDLWGDSLGVGELQLISDALVSETSSRTVAVPLSLSGAFTLRNSDSEELRYFHQDTDSAGGIYSTNKVLHKEVWESADLFVTLNDQGMRENFILKDQQVPTQFDYVVETVDLELRVNENGELQFTDAGGKVEFSAAAPSLTDTIGQQFTGTLRNEISWELPVASSELSEEKLPVASSQLPEIEIQETPEPIAEENNNFTSEEVVIEVVELDEEELVIEVIELAEDELMIEIIETEAESETVELAEGAVEDVEIVEVVESEEVVVNDEVIEETIEEEEAESSEIEEITEDTNLEENAENEVDEKTAKKIANYLKQIEQKLAKGKFEQARNFFKKILDLDSDATEVQALSEKIDQAEQEAIAREMVQYLEQAEQKLAKGKFANARNFVQKVFELEVDNTEAQALTERIDQAEAAAEAAKTAKQKQEKKKDKKGKQAALPKLIQAGKLLADLLDNQTEQEVFAESGASYEEVEQENGSILRRYRLSLDINPELIDLLHYPLSLAFSTAASDGQDSANLNQHFITEEINYGTGFGADLSSLTPVQEEAEEREALVFEIVPAAVANQDVVAPSCGGSGGSVASWISKVDSVLTAATVSPESNTSSTDFSVANIFTDVGEENIYASYINQLASREVISGYEDGSFQPEGYLNRAELLKIALTAFDLELAESFDEQPFTDVPLSAWFTPFVAAAKQQGIVNGYADGSFLPEQTINRVEAIKILLLASGLEVPEDSTSTSFTDVPSDAWFTSLVVFVEKNGIAEGITKSVPGINTSYKVFEPGGQVTRAEVAKMAVLIGSRF